MSDQQRDWHEGTYRGGHIDTLTVTQICRHVDKYMDTLAVSQICRHMDTNRYRLELKEKDTQTIKKK